MSDIQKYNMDYTNTQIGNGVSAFQFGVVVVTDKVNEVVDDPIQRKSNIRFNSDPDMIRCRILGADWDRNVKDEDLPNVYPLLPKHINTKPKKGEVVFIFTRSIDNKNLERYYIGPLISSPQNLNIDREDGTALASLSISPVTPNVDINNIASANGVYPNPQDVSIQGRNNSDLWFTDNGFILRAAQSEINKPLVFNKNNPGYIQLKYGVISKENKKSTSGTVMNMVANKINLLTHSGGSPRYNLTDPNGYIPEDELLKIIKEAHPVPFGDILLDYLKKQQLAFMNHVHRFPGHKPTAIQGENYIKDYIEYPVDTILSKNVKLN